MTSQYEQLLVAAGWTAETRIRVARIEDALLALDTAAAWDAITQWERGYLNLDEFEAALDAVRAARPLPCDWCERTQDVQEFQNGWDSDLLHPPTLLRLCADCRREVGLGADQLVA